MKKHVGYERVSVQPKSRKNRFESVPRPHPPPTKCFLQKTINPQQHVSQEPFSRRRGPQSPRVAKALPWAQGSVKLKVTYDLGLQRPRAPKAHGFPRANGLTKPKGLQAARVPWATGLQWAYPWFPSHPQGITWPQFTYLLMNVFKTNQIEQTRMNLIVKYYIVNETQ